MNKMNSSLRRGLRRAVRAEEYIYTNEEKVLIIKILVCSGSLLVVLAVGLQLSHKLTRDDNRSTIKSSTLNTEVRWNRVSGHDSFLILRRS